MSTEIKFTDPVAMGSGGGSDAEYALGVPGASRTDAPDILDRIYRNNREWQEKYSSVGLADVPDETTVMRLGESLREAGGGAKEAWIHSWQGGPSEDMVISVAEEGDPQVVEHRPLSDVRPLGVQFVLK